MTYEEISPTTYEALKMQMKLVDLDHMRWILLLARYDHLGELQFPQSLQDVFARNKYYLVISEYHLSLFKV